MVGKPDDCVLDRLGLKRPRHLHRSLRIPFLDLNIKVLPEVDLLDFGVGILDRALSIRPPPARCHDPSQAEYRLLRAAEKLVDTALAKHMPVVVALALDGDPLAGGSPRHEIDPNVSSVEPSQRLALGPVGPAPDPVDLEFRFLKRDPHEQLFEPASLLGLVAALFADALKDATRARPSSEVEAQLRYVHHWRTTLDSCSATYRPRWSGKVTIRAVTPPSLDRSSQPVSAASAMRPADASCRAPTGSPARRSR